MSTVADGELGVRLTEEAARQVAVMLANEGQAAGRGLRVYVEQGGCSGMQYGMVFDTPREGDVTREEFGVRVMVDAVSGKYLRGATVTYSDDLNASGFKISNPNARESCGCGKSFET